MSLQFFTNFPYSETTHLVLNGNQWLQAAILENNNANNLL